MPRTLDFQYILTPNGFEESKRLVLDAQGMITEIVSATDAQFDGFLALPGMPNAHSHCFQRALCGLGEIPSGSDTFWSWRESMYRLANAITPEDLWTIAVQAFTDMLRGGYTTVGEFHYLHRTATCAPGSEMADAVIDAAAAAGIRLTLLPVLYQRGGFGQPARTEQKRFLHRDYGSFLEYVGGLKNCTLGIGAHSLRAVDADQLTGLVRGARRLLGEDVPVHIHVSEQLGEVVECVRHTGKTPIALLVDTVGLDAHWNLVHSTHATNEEIAQIEAAGATVVVCPVTEAYLGDGLAPANLLTKAGAPYCIGSDSNVRIDAIEELRWLELGQRLKSERRLRLSDERGTGIPLWTRAADAGAHALGQAVGRIEPGRYGDLVVLDPDKAPLAGHTPATAVDALIMGGDAGNIAAVYVGGEKKMDHGEAADRCAVGDRFSRLVGRLQA